MWGVSSCSSHRLTVSALAVVCHLAAGCGGGSDNATAANDDDVIPVSQIEAPVPTMPPLYALTLSRADGGALLLELDGVWPSAQGVVRPLSRMTGEYIALAYAGDTIVDAVPVSLSVPTPHDFASDGTLESLVLDSVQIQIDATDSPTRIDIVDSSLSVLASVDSLPTVTRATHSRIAGDALFPQYPWIDVLSADDTSPVHDAGAPNGVITLQPDELQLVGSMLDRMPARLVGAIDTLAFSDIEAPGLAWGGHVIIDTDSLRNPRPGRLYWVLVHEAGHAYHNASGLVGGRDFGSWSVDWPNSILMAVRETHRKLGIDRDVLSFWSELHESAVDANLATQYQGEGATAIDSPYYSGFVTGYASSILPEDFADTVAIANFKTVKEFSPGLTAQTCTHFQTKGAAKSEITQFDALAYAKVRLVESMDLADEDSVNDCLGDAAPTYEDGIFLGDAIHFDRGFKAGYTGADRQQFNIIGQDVENRGMAIELATEGQHPIGVYPLDTTWWGSWDGDNTLVIASPSALEARTAWSGVVVISYASSSERVDGFVFDLRLANAFGPISRFDFVPFRIPLD